MYTEQVIDKMRHEIAITRREREAIRPYSPKLKRLILEYAVQMVHEDGVLHDLSAKLGLDEQQLSRWFKELVPGDALDG